MRPAIQDIAGDGVRVPVGRRVELPGRGTTFVREAGDPAAPTTVLLVHGWLASGGLNWSTAFDPLGEHFRVVAPDLRGHGRGIRGRRRFRLEDCADDLAALVAELGCDRVVVVGYSMGGLVAQLLWQRHPEVVDGLVLCSTTRRFLPGRRERYLVAVAMNYGAGTVRWSRMAARLYAPFGMPAPSVLRRRPSSMRMWAAAELRRHDLRQVLEAAQATTQFDSRPWIAGVDVPTAVLVTTRDRALPPDAQRALADAVPGASIYEVDDDHAACGHRPFAAILTRACLDVAAAITRR